MLRKTSAIGLIFALGLISDINIIGTSLASAQPQAPIARPAYIPPPKPSDWELYSIIFDLQSQAKWQAADSVSAKITDPILMGHVYFQRYMHPTAYRTSWTELKSWLTKYADHPGAWQVYKLAEKRKPSRARMPKKPPSRVYHASSLQPASMLFRRSSSRSIQREVKRLVYKERPTLALRYISKSSVDSRLSAAETDSLKSLIARSYYIEGKPKEALNLAIDATRSRADVPMADWHAGLAAYRMNKMDIAIRHFELLAKSDKITERTLAAAHFWAGHSYYRINEPEKAAAHMAQAAMTGLNFYGMLAQQTLTGKLNILWQQVERHDYDEIAYHPAVKRAAALDKAGQRELAELELLYLQERLSEKEARAALDLAKKLNYPAVELAITSRLKSLSLGNVAPNSDSYMQVAFEGKYPVIDASEIGDTTVDRALLFALIRQESRFKARAKSSAGARGLMQIMPRTAAFVTGDRKLARTSGREQLLKTELNLDIGQRYMGMLLSDDYFQNNIIYTLAGYNAGPGTLKRWRREMSDVNDPILFIESLSAPETRKYVQNVMENLWIYRNRLGQDTPSLRLLAAQSWPIYVEQDEHLVQANIKLD